MHGKAPSPLLLGQRAHAGGLPACLRPWPGALRCLSGLVWSWAGHPCPLCPGSQGSPFLGLSKQRTSSWVAYSIRSLFSPSREARSQKSGVRAFSLQKLGRWYLWGDLLSAPAPCPLEASGTSQFPHCWPHPTIPAPQEGSWLPGINGLGAPGSRDLGMGIGSPSVCVPSPRAHHTVGACGWTLCNEGKNK